PVDVDCEQRSATFAPRVLRAARTLDAGALRVRVECPAQAFVRCTGTVRASTVRRVRRRRPARLGRAAYAVVAGTAAEVAIPLDARARSLVRRLAPLRVRVAIRGRDQAGPARPSATRLVLRD
ncbi:MAG TPA: hypothetical protein VGW75_09740, partial [Solirubrobacteraceae bacterium]|nr:hypothetical protein [Solirubrobacteraceae bacterium]